MGVTSVSERGVGSATVVYRPLSSGLMPAAALDRDSRGAGGQYDAKPASSGECVLDHEGKFSGSLCCLRRDARLCDSER